MIKFNTTKTPAAKFSLAMEYGLKKVSFGSHLAYWGKVTTIGDSESGGVFDAVQMGSNGLRTFSKLVFNL